MCCIGKVSFVEQRNKEEEDREMKEEETHFKLSGKFCSRPGYRSMSAARFAAERTLTHLYTSLDMVSRPCCRKQAAQAHMST